ncbi:MAG: hypothetical protein CMF61_08015 [Magnetococcales bacterium]|nr:hypothetical protein [Magnetococcales bacterium]PPR17713.1 MAG: hypothetical protein CFH43_00659 [Pseudomonadota bacterium]
MVHKRTTSDHRGFNAGTPAPKLSAEAAAEFLQTGNITGYDKSLLLGLITEMKTYSEKFQHLRGTPKISIFGSARTQPEHPDYLLCHDFANKLVQDFGYDVITGAGPGIMEAGNKGAGKDHAIGLNISLPFEQDANPYLKDERLITFYYFLIRKLAFVREADGIVLFPGGFGTMDEGFEALTLIQTGRAIPVPVVMMEHKGGTFWGKVIELMYHLRDQGTVSRPDLDLVYYTTDIDDAIKYINDFYYRYHSMRYLENGDAVIRLNRDVPSNLLQELEVKYVDLLKGSKFKVHDKPLPEEVDEPDLKELHRIEFSIDHTKPVDLYAMIRDLNTKYQDGQATNAQEAHKFPRPSRVKVPSSSPTLAETE